MADGRSHTPRLDSIHSFFSAFDNHDFGGMLAQCTDGVQVRFVPMGDKGAGDIRKVGQAFWSGLFDAVPDVAAHITNEFGDVRNTTVEVLIEGTQHKKFERIPSLGRHFVLPHAFLFSLSKNANITKAAIYWDNVTLFSDLGKTTLDSRST